MSNWFAHSNRKPIAPINYSLNEDNSWIPPTLIGLLIGILLLVCLSI